MVLLHEGFDFAGQFLGAGERAAADGLLRDESEPALALVNPGGIDGGVMQVVSGPAGQPRLDLGMLVGGVVVDDEMDVERCGHVGVDVVQEGEEFLVAVTALTLRQYLAGGYIQGGKQGRGAVAHVFVRHPLKVAQPHRQHRLGALQRLHQTLLIRAQHQGMIGRVKA